MNESEFQFKEEDYLTKKSFIPNEKEEEDLKNPKLFIKNYFGDLINELDIRTTKYEIEEETRANENEKVNNEQGNNLKQKIDEVRAWRQLIIEKLEKAEHESLERLTTPDFQLDFKLKEQFKEIIKIYEEEEYDKVPENKSTAKYIEFEKKVYEHSNKVKQEILGNKCFFILNIQWSLSLINLNFKSANYWRNIFPLIQVNGAFIGKKEQLIWK